MKERERRIAAPLLAHRARSALVLVRWAGLDFVAGCCLKQPLRGRLPRPKRRDHEAMNFSQRLTFLFSAPMFDADDLEGLRVNQIIAAIERMGFQVIKARRVEDAEIAVQTDAAIGCMVVDWGKKGIEGKAASLINLMRKRGLDMPIVILVAAQALRGHSGRSARLHRRLCVPRRGDAGIHRQEPGLAPQAICRDAEDAVLRRARRLRRKRATSSGPAPATTAASSIAAARSAASSSSIWARRSFATTSTIRSSNSAIF